MTSIRVGVIGLGMMGRNHVRVLNELEGMELVGVAEPNPSERLPDQIAVVPDLEGLLALDIDACVVAVPTADHEAVGLAVAEAGIHALIEKPLADDTEAARRVAAAFDDRGLIGCVGHIERFNPAVGSLRERLQNGELGSIYQVATRRQGPFPNRIRDVGVVKDLATHDIDLTAYVTGSPYCSVSARTAHKSGREHEDLLAVTATLADGTIANHLVNWLSPMKERTIVVTGERGCFTADTLSADLTFFANGQVATPWDAIARFRGVSEGDVTRFAIIKREPLALELEAFRDAILGHKAPIVSMWEAVRVVEVAAACVEAASTGTIVEIESERV